MSERTEEQKVAQAPIVVLFAGKEYDVRILSMKDSREWKRKAIELVAPLPQLVDEVKTDDGALFGKAMTTVLVEMPEQVCDLFFLYATDLPRDEIESTGTDGEMAIAFQQVLEIAFPLAKSAPNLLGRIIPSEARSNS